MSLVRLLVISASLCSLAAAQEFVASASSAGGGATPSLKVRGARVFPTKHDQVLLRTNGYIPLGAESFQIGDSKHAATIMALAEAPQLGNLVVFQRGDRKHVVSPNGEEISRMPSHITFRVTASSIMQITDKPEKLDCKARMDDFLSKLDFVARVFHPGDLSAEVVRPLSVRIVGIPAEIAAAERVYRAEFDFGPLSVSDHLVLEVNDPDGAPVTKFFLQLK